MVGALTFYWCLLVQQRASRTAGRVTTFARITRPADVAIGAGMLMTRVFEIWLAIYVDGYELWDGWIVAGFVLWAIGAAAGGRSGREFNEARERVAALPPEAEGDWTGETRRATALHVITTVAALLILLDMIWKPGA